MLRIHLLPSIQFTGKALGTSLEDFTYRRSCCNWKQPQAPMPNCPGSNGSAASATLRCRPSGSTHQGPQFIGVLCMKTIDLSLYLPSEDVLSSLVRRQVPLENGPAA